MAKASSVNGKAYTFVDHKFDVVVVGAGGAAAANLGEGGAHVGHDLRLPQTG